MINIGFITGARSDLGVMKSLILSIQQDKRFNTKVYVTGMHLVEKYGLTYKEIVDSGINISKSIPVYTEEGDDKAFEFTNVVNQIYNNLKNEELDVIYILGDRIEAYGAALAAHFHKLPIAHFAGGQITEGAVDNIYRYNISNLSTLHFVTNILAKEKLSQIPIVNSNNVFCVGSTAIDSIYDYLKAPLKLNTINEELKNKKYVVITFHPTTLSYEPIDTILDFCIKEVIQNELQVLLTYPNNDEGSEPIIDIINKWRNHNSVFIYENLGAKAYYTAIYHSAFVLGNSSSGIIEVPYFSKYTINIGDRQKGRLAPPSVISVSPDKTKIKHILSNLSHKKPPTTYQYYGEGKSVIQITEILNNFFKD